MLIDLIYFIFKCVIFVTNLNSINFNRINNMYQSSSQQQGMTFSYKLFNCINELVSYCNEIS